VGSDEGVFVYFSRSLTSPAPRHVLSDDREEPSFWSLSSPYEAEQERAIERSVASSVQAKVQDEALDRGFHEREQAFAKASIVSSCLFPTG